VRIVRFVVDVVGIIIVVVVGVVVTMAVVVCALVVLAVLCGMPVKVAVVNVESVVFVLTSAIGMIVDSDKDKETAITDTNRPAVYETHE